MATRCPTCSRVNPPNAAYCYYDGRGLNDAARNGPLGLGAMPFPMPFSFSDGQGCSNYNQLVLACDRHWGEARNNLVNGTWRSFFGAIGRADLAALAKQLSTHGDPDTGLCRLLEGLPADAEALRPAKLALPSFIEDLGALEPGKDYKIDLVIENQGMLMLSGSAQTDCEWLSFGDRVGASSSKIFQTRDTYTLPVRVLGGKLRAGKQPIEGQIIIDTNGGRKAVAVRATVPIRAFPKLPGASAVLTGAASPRDIALKAKTNAQEAAVLFEQGAVKAWYQSNGWSYPIEGTQARGKGALQQFFEALGLSKAPRLQVNTTRIDCQGEAGEQLTKKVVVHTAESKFVYADAHSNRDWIKPLPPEPHGNSVALPFRIEVPRQLGETLEGTVFVVGNGRQKFEVPVKLAIAETTAEQREAAANRKRWLIGSAMAAGFFLFLAIPLALVIKNRLSGKANPPPDPAVVETNPGDPIEPPGPKVETWWDGIPDTHLSASLAKVRRVAPADRATFDRVQDKSEVDRRTGYEQLAAKLPVLARNPDHRQALGQFVSECCVFEPSELNIVPLLRGIAHQFPAEDSPFAPEDKGTGVECAAFWLQVVCDTLSNKAARPDRSRSLVSEINNVLASPLDATLPADEFKVRAEKVLAEQCYHNLRPTAEKSVEQALAIRDVLLARFPMLLNADIRDPEDVKLLAIGLSSGEDIWPKLEPIFKNCLQNNAPHIGAKLMDLYEKAKPELAVKMDMLLAIRWKIAANANLTQADKAAAIRRSMAAARIPYANRLKRLQALLAKSPLTTGKSSTPAQKAMLQDSVVLAHASTMAAILFNKDADVVRFDDLIGTIPGSEPDKMAQDNKPDEKPKQANTKEVIDLSTGNYVVQEKLTDECDLDPRRDTYRKVYSVQLQAGEIYVLDMRSNDLTPYLRVETRAGARLADERGAKLHLTFSPPASGVYLVVVSSVDKKAVGNFTLQIAKQQIIRYGMGGYGPPWARPFGPRPRPVAPKTTNPTGATKVVDQDASPFNPNDLKDLDHRQSNVRIAAFKNLVRGLPDDLNYRYAQKIANYLLVTEWDAPEAELEAVTGQLPVLARCRRLLEALADTVANNEKLAQKRTEAIAGGLLGQQLRFAPDEDWRTACRKLLLQRAVDLTGHATSDADKTAEYLRDLYKDQGLAFGLEAPDFHAQMQLAVVLERLIGHVAALAAKQKHTPAETAYLEQIVRRLPAVRFAAQNDLEHVVLLQRIWIKVLALAVQERVPAPAQKEMRAIQQQLDKKDRDASNLLAQLRSGEENILRVWTLAFDLKPQ